MQATRRLVTRTELFFTAYGDPAPQGSKKVIHGRLVEASKKVKPWRAAVKAAFQMAVQETGDDSMFEGAVKIKTTFYLSRPATVTKKKRPVPTVPPDLDKLERGLFDALTEAGVWTDDAIVVKSCSEKLYADDHGPGAVIAIEKITFS